MNFLKSIGRREVEFLKELIEGGRATTRAMFISFANAVDCDWLSREQFETLIERLSDNFDYAYFTDLVVDVAECTGILFTEVALLGEQDGEYTEISTNLDWEKRDRRDKAAAVLGSLGILERLDFRNIKVPRLGPDAELFVKGYRVTPAGIAFYEACTGVRFKHKFERDVDDDQTEGFRAWSAARANVGSPYR